MSSYVLKSSSEEMADPGHLNIRHLPLQSIANSTIKFLGLAIQVPKDNVSAKSELKYLLQSLLTAVDETLLTRREKLKLYSLEILSQVKKASHHQ